MSKRRLIGELVQLIEAKDQAIERAVLADEFIQSMIAEMQLLCEIRDVLQEKAHVAKPGPKAPITLGQRPLVRRDLQFTEFQIVELIESEPSRLFALMELLTRLEMPERTLKNCLGRLVDDGFVARPRRGFYQARGKRRSRKD